MELIKYLDENNIDYVIADGNITVGGYLLYLRGCTGLTELPDGLTVGGFLDLRGCTGLTQLPDGLTVGGSIYLRGLAIKPPKKRNKLPEGFSASVKMSIEVKFNAKGYTIADGILARVLQSKGGLKKIMIVGKKTASWLASDDKGNYAHGDTSHEAVQELAFKSGERDVSQFANMPKNTVKTPQEWAFVYRMVTGACQYGTKRFVESKGVLKSEYTLAEIIEQTSGAYGSETFRKVVSGN